MDFEGGEGETERGGGTPPLESPALLYQIPTGIARNNIRKIWKRLEIVSGIAEK
jgi:hypothetical protein